MNYGVVERVVFPAVLPGFPANYLFFDWFYFYFIAMSPWHSDSQVFFKRGTKEGIPTVIIFWETADRTFHFTLNLLIHLAAALVF